MVTIMERTNITGSRRAGQAVLVFEDISACNSCSPIFYILKVRRRGIAIA
jgi:hypothetical protein